MEPLTEQKACLFTICSRNYLHCARTLMESARRHAPDVDRYVALCDINEGFDPIDSDLLILIDLNSPRIDRLDEMISKYTVMELNTAIKPSIFRHLYDELGYTKVIYFDPDIRIYNSMDELLQLLDQHPIVLTPHLTAPIADDRHPSEETFLQCGTYNLGFMATSRSPATAQLMQWWAERLFDGCAVDLPRGLFTDQKWIDLVPGFFDNVHVCRHPGWNVAYWNLMHRTLERRDQEISVNGSPLFFFHFSGITADAAQFSKHQDRYSMANVDPVARELATEYCASLQENGASTYSRMRYGYTHFPSGNPIPDFIRRIYRDNKKLASELGPLTSADGETKWMEYALEIPRGYDFLNRAALAMYEMRIDLNNTFPDLSLGNELPYARWFADNGAAQPDMPESFVKPVQGRLDARRRFFFPFGFSSGPKGQSLKLWAYRILYQIAWRMQKVVTPLTSQATRCRAHQFLANLAYGRRSTIQRASAPRSTPAAAGLNVIGYLTAESGVGRAAQLTLDASAAAEIPIAITNFEVGCVSRCDVSLPAGLETGTPHSINLFHINADQIPVAHSQLGPSVFEGRYNIGYWYWEMPEFPDEWLSSFQHLDEIWVGSTFCQQSIASKSPIPVVVMPPGISVHPDPQHDRNHFGLPSDRFLFLTMADGLSFLERKNPLGVIQAFREAFPDPAGKVALVIKMINSDRAKQSAASVRDAIADDPSIILIDRYLSRSEVDSLIQQSDAYVSLHRSEGFGLPLAEAMLLGKPVIATGWSANTDFMHAHNSYLVDYAITELTSDYGPYRIGMHWAVPVLSHAAHCMREVHDGGPEVRKRTQRATADLSTLYAPARAGSLIQQRLNAIRSGSLSTKHGIS